MSVLAWTRPSSNHNAWFPVYGVIGSAYSSSKRWHCGSVTLTLSSGFGLRKKQTKMSRIFQKSKVTFVSKKLMPNGIISDVDLLNVQIPVPRPSVRKIDFVTQKTTHNTMFRITFYASKYIRNLLWGSKPVSDRSGSCCLLCEKSMTEGATESPWGHCECSKCF